MDIVKPPVMLAHILLSRNGSFCNLIEQDTLTHPPPERHGRRPSPGFGTFSSVRRSLCHCAVATGPHAKPQSNDDLFTCGETAVSPAGGPRPGPKPVLRDSAETLKGLL